ncbi:MAG TPA: AI-2E family transporter [Chthoniobacterales bacterium]|jgi:predicted PurR-regulated permease PerM|nr:AI-2E family transporter [Chthoniobacterales bacterium]
MSVPTKISYGVLVAMLVVAAWLHLGPLVLAAFFSYFALRKIYGATNRKWISVILFIVGLVGITYAAGFFGRAAWRALPEIAESSIPSATAWAEQRNIELPFTDFETLKAFLIEQLKDEIHYLNNVAHFAGAATTLFVLVVIGIVVASSLFFRSWFTHEKQAAPGADGKNLYTVCAKEIATRFHDFYRSFEVVMGAQIIISSINTALTAIFVLVIGLPHAAVVIGVTFLCGLLPIIGNLISNTIIVFLSATISLKFAFVALIFLIAIHKLEYFLNSKIVGGWTRNPVWLTLIGLIIGQAVMGIPGMVLAPVVLTYLRVEMSKIELKTTAA